MGQKRVKTTRTASRRKTVRKAPPARDVTLITGASGGIGEALAGEFAAGGSDLVLVARSKDKLERICRRLADERGIDAIAIPADLAKPGAAGRLQRAVRARKRHVETLVNNAGVLEMGAFAEIRPSRHLELVQLNVIALTELTRAFVPAMIERQHGRIMNVASIAAFQPVPSLASYAATKAYVLSLTEALSQELKAHGITATALCPGITDTNMVSTMKGKHKGAAKIPGFLVADAAGVAAEGYQACIKGEVIRVPGVINMAAAVAGRASPRWLVRAISGALGRLAT